jgi:hypothetical protein
VSSLRTFIPTSPTGYLFPTANALANDNEYLGKLDYTISSSDTLSATFTAHDSETTSHFGNANVTRYTAGTFGQTYSGNIETSTTLTPSRPRC